MTEAQISDQPAGEPASVAPYRKPDLPTPTPAPAEATPMAAPVATGGSSEVRPNPTIRPDGWVDNPVIMGSTGNASFGGDISRAHGQLAHYTGSAVRTRRRSSPRRRSTTRRRARLNHEGLTERR